MNDKNVLVTIPHTHNPEMKAIFNCETVELIFIDTDVNNKTTISLSRFLHGVIDDIENLKSEINNLKHIVRDL